MCVIYFFVWMFLLWEVVKKAEGKNVGWIVLSALGSSLCAFLCGLLLSFLCFNCGQNMEFKTKHNIGDEVWCNLFNGIKVKINGIHIIAVAPDNVTIEYSVMWNGGAWSRMENELFSTKEEMLNSL